MAEPADTSGAESPEPAAPPPSPPPSPPPRYPPYPPYDEAPAPPSVAETVVAGNDTRVRHKSVVRPRPFPLPRPARPKTPKVTDIPMTRSQMRAHARCLRRHGAVLTDRLEWLAKPKRRTVIQMWRDNADRLPPEAIERFRAMLNADEPFKPDQAYEYFITCRKTKKKAVRCSHQVKRNTQTVVTDKRFVWARNATVAFARGIQQRLTRPGHYALADGMLRLSNVILAEICGYMRMRTPPRRSNNAKAKFMMEMSDKIAVWIDEILSESDDRLLMMDFDEDEDILNPNRFMGGGGGGGGGDGDDFADDFLNMMGGAGLLRGPTPAYLNFQGEMLDAFNILTDSMEKKGGENLLSYGKFNQSYAEGADELKKTPEFTATEFNTQIAGQLNKDLTATAAPNTPPDIAPFMKEMVNICSNFLAQHAEFNKDKGPAFKFLVEAMKKKSKDDLFHKEKIKRTYGQGAKLLEQAKGMETDHDDPNLSQDVHKKLSDLVKNAPPELKEEMAEALDLSSKYLSQYAVDEVERGPAFEILLNQLKAQGSEDFTPQFEPVKNKCATAYVLESSPGLSGVTPDPATAPAFVDALHRGVDEVCPADLKQEMSGVIERSANYLSAFVRDRDKALEIVIKTMKKHPTKELAKRGTYTMDYGTGATEVETAPTLMAYLPVKDIADEIKVKLDKDTEPATPANLKAAVKSAVKDVSKHLSQAEAVRSGAAGERYQLNFLSAVMDSAGKKKLYKEKNLTQTYHDGGNVLKYAGKLESPHGSEAENLKVEIETELQKGMPTKISPGLAASMGDTMSDAAKHLAKSGVEKAEAVERLIKVMKEEGDAPLGKLQGYEQTYNDGAKRIQNADTLANAKVDKATYENVHAKLKTLVEKKVDQSTAKTMPGVVDEVAQFLSAPLPETPLEKRQVIADLMSRKEHETLAQDGDYKVDYTEGGKEVLHAPVGVTKAQDEKKKKEIADKIDDVIPNKDLKALLRDTKEEGAAYLADEVKGVGEAMGFIEDKLKKEGDKDFLHVGKFDKTFTGAADMLSSSPGFGGENPNQMIKDMVDSRLDKLNMEGASDLVKKHMHDAKDKASNYIADVATKESGLDAQGISAWKAAGGGAEGAGGVGAGGVGAGGVGAGGVGAGGLGVGGVGASGVGGVGADGMGGLGADGMGGLGADGAGGTRGAGVAGGAHGVGGPGGVGGAYNAGGAGGTGGAGGWVDKDEEARRKREAARRAAARRKGKSGGDTDADEEEIQAARDILHNVLRAKGGETFYKQPQAELSHKAASDWLKEPSTTVHPSVREAGDTTRLAKKFEKKLDTLVNQSTPTQLQDVMKDVVVESSRDLAEYFVGENYKGLVKDALISEMQKHGKHTLIEIRGTPETNFFAAQRLKKARGQIPTAAPLPQEEAPKTIAHLCRKLEETIKCRSMPRKLIGTMKEHIWNASHYLADIVTTPDPKIAAYVALLREMDNQGAELIVQGEIPKSYKDSAAYLRLLTSCDDQINLSNSSLESTISSNMHKIMNNVLPESGYNKGDLDAVITEQAKLLVSYIMLQVQRTALLKVIVERMNSAKDDLLLRHGEIRKSNSDGAHILSGKNTDQLTVTGADPVVERKLQIKIDNLMAGVTAANQAALMDGVISDVTRYLAVHLLQPHVIQVCKCMKNVFVQCELWCDEIMRRMSRPCCSCSRQLSVGALADLAPGNRLICPPGTGHAYASGVDIAVKPCLRASRRGSTGGRICPAPNPTKGCTDSTAYMMYSTEYDRQRQRDVEPTRLPRTPLKTSAIKETKSSTSVPSSSESDMYAKSDSDVSYYYTARTSRTLPDSPNLSRSRIPDWSFPSKASRYGETPALSSGSQTREMSHSGDFDGTRTPIVSTDQMADWHAMMVSLTWNVHAWRKWIQDTIDRALSYHHSNYSLSNKIEEPWSAFQRKIATEALQWRQYHMFSRQLVLRLISRYKDKKIVSPTRATVKNRAYTLCQKEMLDIINMFDRWTHWLALIVKETELLRPSMDIDTPLYTFRWNHFKNKVEEYSEDWNNYNIHLKVYWEEQFMKLIPEWLAAWEEGGPVWVVSACGAVPSGAVSAGAADDEPTWVARSTHQGRVLPAALQPSKHCCVLYADGRVHHYTKYQVLCNADGEWIPWSVGRTPPTHALVVAPNVLVGRVLYRGSHLLGAVPAPAYRCHVVIVGRPFAFNAYELLVLADSGA